jgi:hypothetical protein
VKGRLRLRLCFLVVGDPEGGRPSRSRKLKKKKPKKCALRFDLAVPADTTGRKMSALLRLSYLAAAKQRYFRTAI